MDTSFGQSSQPGGSAVMFRLIMKAREILTGILSRCVYDAELKKRLPPAASSSAAEFVFPFAFGAKASVS